MITAPKLKLVQELISGSTKEELIWINGYLSGLMSNTDGVGSSPSATAVDRLTLVYGSETGNSKKLALGFAARARQKGLRIKLTNLEQYRISDLEKEEYFFAVISTQGEGEPPASAKKFYEHLFNNNISLPALKYSVLALGDTAYPLFCKAGEDVDLQLEKSGAQRVHPLVRCDTDYTNEAEAWFNGVLDLLASGTSASTVMPVAKAAKSGKQYYSGTVRANINLNDRGSAKTTHHIEIEVADVVYEPGDCLGLIPPNPKQLVDRILDLLGTGPELRITYRDEDKTLAELFGTILNVTCLPQRVIQRYAALVEQEIPASMISLADLLKIYPLRDPGQLRELVALLEPIAPRLYSISSSPEAHPGEVHLTVAHNRYCVGDDWRYGLCSDYLVEAAPGTTIRFYIHRNSHFRLPDPDRPVIMIGPGTGIAPFRAFLAHRDATGATGKNWLFFGEQHFDTDFLYQTEIQSWMETGLLSRVNTAFSRDQQQKIYVQDRMLREQQALREWIREGAVICVCGSKNPMSVDVEQTLLQILQDDERYSVEEARNMLDTLKEEDRLLLDVY